MSIIGIKRGTAYSPNREDADAAIFEAVATRLETRGVEVLRWDDATFQNAFPDDNPTFDIQAEAALAAADGLFSMSRDPLTLCLIDIVERIDHLPCVNSAEGVITCTDRRALYRVMEEAGVPQPQTSFGCLWEPQTDDEPTDAYELTKIVPYPVWLKRCWGHTQVNDDVVLATNQDETTRALRAFVHRDVGLIAFCQHIEGDHIKFYGVADTEFFDATYADPAQSKLGHDVANGTPRHHAFDARQLQEHCEAVARKLRVPVYGGDAIVRANGSYCIIDFNDWPSFGHCREEAADAIAESIVKSKK